MKRGFLLPLLSRRGQEEEEGEIYLILLSLLSLSNQSKFAYRKGAMERRESSEGRVACCLSFMKFFFLFVLFLLFFGCVNGAKAISSRPFNHVMTGFGPVSVCVCVNCGPIDQSQRWGDGIEGQGWPWTQQLPGSLPSFPTPLGPAQGHLSKFYLIPEVLDLSVIAYERGDWPPLWAFF